MANNTQHFDKLVASGNPVGEITAIDRFLIRVNGLQPCAVHALVMFEDGSKGIVHQVNIDHVVILHLGVRPLRIGMVVALQYQELVTKVGKDFIGRVVTVTGEPLDGKGPVIAASVWPVFNTSPPLYMRRLLEDQLESGLTAIDALFPIVRGQRIALIGDSKTGKSTITTQLTINQKNSDQVVVYCLIAKKRSDVDALLTRLQESGSLEKSIVVVATMFESLVMSYLAPYVACSIAEYLWQACDQDTVIIYDDLTAHAQTYREISLLSGVSPGRDSYPGDMFFAHSSLLERAGRLDKSGKCLTSISVVHAANDDITAYLPTNIMSITDGQWILDMETFRSSVRPALNIGLSVSRSGGVGHNKRQKAQSAQIVKILADYRQVAEFSHFGSELALESKHSLVAGKRISEVLTQGPLETYSLMEQQLMLDLVMNLAEGEDLDINVLKQNVREAATKIIKEEQYEAVRDQLKSVCMIKLEGAPKSDKPEVEANTTSSDKPVDSSEVTKSDNGVEKADKRTSKKQLTGTK